MNKYLKATFAPPPEIATIFQHVHGLVRLLDTHVIPIGQVDTDTLLDVRMGQVGEPARAHFLTMDPETGNIEIAAFEAIVVR